MHQRIITVLAIVFGLSTAIFGALYFQKENGLPKLPVPASANSGQRSAAESASLVASDALYYPYYFGAPQYTYQYDLATEFPALGTETMVYTITAKKYDRAAAVALASRFGLTDDPIEQEGSFIFGEGSTPGADIFRSSPGSSGSGSAGSSDTTTETSDSSSGPGITGIPSEEKSTIEPSEPTIIVDPSTIETITEPTPAVTFTGRQLTISADGSISYYDYSAVRTTVMIAPDDFKTKEGSQLPEGVPNKDTAIDIATSFLRSTGLLPAEFDAVASDPYGSISVTVTPKHNGYAIQGGAMTIEIADAGKVASLYLRDVVIADYLPYPTKSAAETLRLELLTYRIEKVTIKYASSYDANGIEYAQPVYVLTGTDSLGNDFTFEVPAVKAEFLEQNQIQPLREGFPTAF